VYAPQRTVAWTCGILGFGWWETVSHFAPVLSFEQRCSRLDPEYGRPAIQTFASALRASISREQDTFPSPSAEDWEDEDDPEAEK